MTAACVDYQPDRFVALDLVGRGLICAVDGMTQRIDNADLAPGVFAALITLRAAECFTLRPPAPNSGDHWWTARLTPLGVQLLREFATEHDRRSTAAATDRAGGKATEAIGSSAAGGLGR